MSTPIEKVILKLSNASAAATQAVYGVIGVWAVETVKRIKSDLAGGVNGVKSRSGTLSRAVTQSVTKDGDIVTARIGVFGGVPYASAMESGSPPHRIDPVTAKALRFKPAGASRYIFARFVNHPGNPAYGFVSKPAAEMTPLLRARLAAIGATIRDS